MNNFQKISSAVVIFGLLGLGACASSQPSKKDMCISTPEQYAERCGPDAPKYNDPDCLGEDFICLKDERNDISREIGAAVW